MKAGLPEILDAARRSGDDDDDDDDDDGDTEGVGDVFEPRIFLLERWARFGFNFSLCSL